VSSVPREHWHVTITDDSGSSRRLVFDNREKALEVAAEAQRHHFIALVDEVAKFSIGPLGEPSSAPA
jgi:hypothetical protein